MTDLVYGVHSVREGLRNPRRRPLELFLLPSPRSPRLEELCRAAQEAGIPIRERGRQDLDRLAGTGHHQGAVLRLEPFPYADLEELLETAVGGAAGLLLALDGITDPHNFGAILRSAAAAGCRGVVVPADRSCPVTAAVDRASAGVLGRLPLCRVVNLARSLDRLKQEGYWVYGLDPAAAADDLYGSDLEGNLVLVVGSEGKGLRPNVRRRCDRLLAIPMASGVESLNASVAAAVVLFEAVRQRRQSPGTSG